MALKRTNERKVPELKHAVEFHGICQCAYANMDLSVVEENVIFRARRGRRANVWARQAVKPPYFTSIYSFVQLWLMGSHIQQVRMIMSDIICSLLDASKR